jgi:hypothetical protein
MKLPDPGLLYAPGHGKHTWEMLVSENGDFNPTMVSLTGKIVVCTPLELVFPKFSTHPNRGMGQKKPGTRRFTK